MQQVEQVEEEARAHPGCTLRFLPRVARQRRRRRRNGDPDIGRPGRKMLRKREGEPMEKERRATNSRGSS